ncbi:hypothetical protein [Streptomyces tremellae]|uniref:Lipoprotein n=1 Tax=Streptomyces tremellae TaxID=1124239 RepID=A0ABP7FYM5_9ACTN
MIILVLIGVLVLVAGGCVCAVRAAHGGPRPARAAAMVTLASGEMARRSGADRRRGTNESQGADG